MIIPFDYDEVGVPMEVKILKPPIFHDGDHVCVLLGEDPQAGIFGCAKELDEALGDWQHNLRERLQKADANDEFATFLKNSWEKKEG